MNNFFNRIASSKSILGHKLLFTIILTFISFGGFAQEASQIFISDEPFNPKTTGKLSLAIDNLNFFKNNEYKSKYVDGYTLTGTWVRPKLLFYPDKQLRFELGGEILTYNGRDDYKFYPWFSVLYQPKKNFSLRMGNLNEDQNHGLPEPLRDSEHFINGQPEAGIQAKFKNQRFKADLWIDWQKMIFKGDPFKERFVFGAVTELTLFKAENSKLSLPITFSGLHEGGEIDTAPGLAHTYLTISEGIRFDHQLSGSLFKSWLIESTLFQSTYPEGETVLPTKKGTAFYLRGGITSGYGNLTAGFWQGHHFFTPLGMPLFQNSALNEPFGVRQNRLLTLSYLYDRKIFDQSKFGFAFDLFYNPATRRPSNSAALYLVVNLSVLFKKSVN
jgi:hypothetical protein